MRADNACGAKGVHWHERDKRWHARLQINGERKLLGCYKTKEQAKAAYDLAAYLYHGEYARC